MKQVPAVTAATAAGTLFDLCAGDISHSIGFSNGMSRLMWLFTGPPENLYANINMVLPDVVSRIIVHVPSFVLAIAVYRHALLEGIRFDLRTLLLFVTGAAVLFAIGFGTVEFAMYRPWRCAAMFAFLSMVTILAGRSAISYAP